mgnify:CR=1 FL=1
MKEKYKEFSKNAQQEIKDLSKQIETILHEWEVEAQKLFDEQGVEAFENAYDPQYLGVDTAYISINKLDECLYLFVDGLDSHLNDTGWFPSTYLE